MWNQEKLNRSIAERKKAFLEKGFEMFSSGSIEAGPVFQPDGGFDDLKELETLKD